MQSWTTALYLNWVEVCLRFYCLNCQCLDAFCIFNRDLLDSFCHGAEFLCVSRSQIQQEL